MDNYVNGNSIKKRREVLGLTQAQLAKALCVSDKTISKWETGRGLPDITFLEPLAQALGVSLPELLSGEVVNNDNRSANMLKIKIYVCPVCGNVFTAAGKAVVSCCGIMLPPLEAEPMDDEHMAVCERLDDEIFVSINHPMMKKHYISFIMYCTGDRLEVVKLYPEGGASALFFRRGRGKLYWYCNHHGLFSCGV